MHSAACHTPRRPQFGTKRSGAPRQTAVVLPPVGFARVSPSVLAAWPELRWPPAALLSARPRRRLLNAGRVAPLAIVAGLLAAGCSAASSAGSGQDLSPGIAVFKAGTRPVVPAVAGTLIGGGKFSLVSYRGHVVVLNFWGSWCGVCREEAPGLSAAASHFRASEVRFLGVDVGDNPASASAYASTYRISYPSLNDPSDGIALDFHNTIPIAAFPSTLVISRDGRIAGRIIGATTYHELISMITKTAAQPG